MAIEDAVVLAQKVVVHGSDLPAAFAEYQQERYLRTARCQIMARIYGGFYHAEGVTRELATNFLKARSTEDSFDSLAWLYDFDPGKIWAPES